MNMRKIIPITLFLALLASPARTENENAVVYLSGDDSVPIGQEIKEGTVLETNNGVTMRLPDGSHVEMGEKTSMRVDRLARAPGGEPTRLHLNRGSLRATVTSRPSGTTTFQISTPIAVAGVRGTDFAVAYEPDAPTAITLEEASADVDVFEGEVVVEQEGQENLSVKAGEGASASRRALRKRKVREEARERWESVRGKLVDHLRNRFKTGDSEMEPDLKEFLQKLPPELREEIKAKVKERIQKHVKKIRERKQEEARLQEIKRQKVKDQIRTQRENRRNRRQ